MPVTEDGVRTTGNINFIWQFSMVDEDDDPTSDFGKVDLGRRWTPRLAEVEARAPMAKARQHDRLPGRQQRAWTTTATTRKEACDATIEMDFEDLMFGAAPTAAKPPGAVTVTCTWDSRRARR